MCSHVKKTANTRLSPGAHGVLVHAHIKRQLTTVGIEVLFVVNSIKKLHRLSESASSCLLITRKRTFHP